ncbi:sulfur carrier protein ThiS [Macrococcus carouselicus]|uniref:Sulfur carrier protein ThiS n=1 Tax=Macrococcus carouselicus TaxID=69969 RepID=A0A9Q8FPR2_9STAP|nr:sulfur carrier protein ThiS [Macrococcus carouselicus]TDM02269.1 sulfur carrier protein ThiS [Macrococcus carouselicus]
MIIILNGENYTTQAETLQALIRELRIDDRRIVVLIDDEPIKETAFATTRLVQAMRLELLEFVGGG